MIKEFELKEQVIEKLPSLPKVIHEVWEIIDKKDADLSKVSEIIGKDITLSAKVLKLVNSPFYGFPNRISSIKHAVVLLGLNAIKGLLISTLVFGEINEEIRDMWNHACDCATIAAVIAKVLDIKEADELTAAGLLHDMGKVILKNYFPEIDEKIKAIKKRENITDFEAEKKVMGISHDIINGWIVEKWHFPPLLTQAIVFHHNISGAYEKYRIFPAVISLADFLSHLYRFAPDRLILPDIDERLCDILNLNTEIIDKILSEVVKTLHTINWDESL